mgnify:CR=1 FL=1
MHTTITQDPGTGHVTLAYDDPITGDRVTREFFVRDAPASYVRELGADGRVTQPCDALASRGSTLMCDSRAALLPLIRREWAALRKALKADGYF